MSAAFSSDAATVSAEAVAAVADGGAASAKLPLSRSTESVCASPPPSASVYASPLPASDESKKPQANTLAKPKLKPEDFEFAGLLGEGSYAKVSAGVCAFAAASSGACARVRGAGVGAGARAGCGLRVLIVMLSPFSFCAAVLRSSQVLYATMKGTEKEYAVKVVDKQFVRRLQKEGEMINEKRVLSGLDHPNVVKLFYTFQDEYSLCTYWLLHFHLHFKLPLLYDDCDRDVGVLCVA